VHGSVLKNYLTCGFAFRCLLSPLHNLVNLVCRSTQSLQDYFKGGKGDNTFELNCALSDVMEGQGASELKLKCPGDAGCNISENTLHTLTRCRCILLLQPLGSSSVFMHITQRRFRNLEGEIEE
jgi:hypothetical protein